MQKKSKKPFLKKNAERDWFFNHSRKKKLPKMKEVTVSNIWFEC